MEQEQATSYQEITHQDFLKVLSRYDDFIEELSRREKSSKSHTPPPTLSELDRWRLIELPGIIQQRKKESSGAAWLEKDEVKKLIQWKLKHGTFRPRMMKLVESNSAEEIKNVTMEALKLYDSDAKDNLQSSLSKLCSLKGIGPASASLLLSIYDPANVPFFSDECFRWVMYVENQKGQGWEREIAYTAKTYNVYFEKVQKLRERLRHEDDRISACDVERVGFVIGKEAAAAAAAAAGSDHKRQVGAGKEKGEPSSSKRARDAPEEDPISSRTRKGKRSKDT